MTIKYVFNPITGQLDAIDIPPIANSTTTGLLSSDDWNIFNSKLDSLGSNYISNPDAEIDTVGWNLYNNIGRTDPATYTNQDITFTSVAIGNSGNGIIINYIFHVSQSYTTPLVTVVSPTNITVAWYNGPTIANNPTATQLKAAWDATPGAVAIVTCSITGTASDKQYIIGSGQLIGGGDTAPTTGTGGTPTGLTFVRNTVDPLAGGADFLFSKDAVDREGLGLSTDFTISRADSGSPLQVSFVYESSADMDFGTFSDLSVWIYDITNAVFIPVTSRNTLVGPASTVKTFIGQFLSSPTSFNYRLVLHISTSNADAWDINLDQIIATSYLNVEAATQVPSVVLQNQPVSGAVTDHMAVAWKDGATSWVPLTYLANADRWSNLGFATNINSGLADIYVRGYMDGFSFGPFKGYNQYVDPANPGLLTPLPSPFTDNYIIMGKAISETAINIQPYLGFDLITSKGGLLSNNGLNNGTGDSVLSVGANGNVLVANSAQTLGLQWAPAVVAAAPFTYTLATRTLTIATATDSVAGVMSAADHQLLHSPVTIGTANGLSINASQVLSMAAATNSVPGALSAADHTTYSGYAASIALKANIASPTFTGTATAPTFSGALTGNVTGNVSGSAASFTGNLVGDVGGTQGATLIGANKVINAKLAQMAAHTFKGNNTGSTANAIDLTANELSAELNSGIVNQSSVGGATVTAALNTLNQSIQEVLLSSIKNAGSVTANTTIANWTATSRDTLSGFNSTTGVYTVAADGDLLVNFTAAITLGTPLAQVYKNGTLVQTGIGSLTRTSVSTVVPNCVIGDTITVALDTTGTLTSVNTDTILNINQISGSPSAVINARYTSATATITGTLSNVTYTTKVKDTNNAYSGGVYTVPVGGSGMYNIYASLSVTATTVAAGQAQVLTIFQGATEIARYSYIAGAATQKPNTLIVNDFFPLVAGDQITVKVSSASTTPVVSASTSLNRFFIYKQSN